ncbi:uncharacterized protein VP01_9006g1 [Puccinia sorghi]|uniref:Retrotransposon gag domain-containing protein n=1 Tax=Puccinia sorghi TaxID=27349 RepID=A0A0L6U8F6_9BASI|nr:uncharacterized protein VP01_9006g1 [Puccinia sorghi]
MWMKNRITTPRNGDSTNWPILNFATSVATPLPVPLHLPHTRWPFLQQTGLYCLAHPDQFPDDRRKIIFMLTNLSGYTLKGAQPLNQWVLNESDLDVTPPTLAKFITSFNGYFLDPERKGKAQQALSNFKQSGNCGGLKENIQLAIVSSGKAFPTLPDIQALAMQLGNELEANCSHTFKISPPTHSTTATNPNAMDLLAMNGRCGKKNCLSR